MPVVAGVVARGGELLRVAKRHEQTNLIGCPTGSRWERAARGGGGRFAVARGRILHPRRWSPDYAERWKLGPNPLG